jgi:hypothetical protein
METLKPKIVQASDDFHILTEESIPLIQALKGTTKGLNRMSKKIEKSVLRGDYNMKKIFEPMVMDVQVLLQEMSVLSRRLEQNPSDFLFKSRQKRKAPGE